MSIHVRRLIETLREEAGVSVLLASDDDLRDPRRTSWFYRFVLSVETWLTAFFIPRIRTHRHRHTLSCVPLASAKREAFDLILNLTDAQLKAASLPKHVDGVIDVRFGDLSRGIEGPPGFWESCLALGATGRNVCFARPHLCLFGPLQIEANPVPERRKCATRRLSRFGCPSPQIHPIETIAQR
ncbi:MAG: hypothetical protein O3A57_08925 [Bacteroidetes bacterium]|nr:hypothetical protein [Bacteroidota bacterium]